LTFEDRYDSGRTTIYKSAIEMGRRYPVFGGGLDGFQASSPQGLYQHNVFLEAFSEGGLIGLGLLSWLVLTATKRSIRPSSVHGAAYAAAFFLILVSSQFSGDLYDSRALFLLPVLIGAAQYAHRTPSKR
jgi:O-antigen ligase